MRPPWIRAWLCGTRNRTDQRLLRETSVGLNSAERVPGARVALVRCKIKINKIIVSFCHNIAACDPSPRLEPPVRSAVGRTLQTETDASRCALVRQKSNDNSVARTTTFNTCFTYSDCSPFEIPCSRTTATVFTRTERRKRPSPPRWISIFAYLTLRGRPGLLLQSI